MSYSIAQDSPDDDVLKKLRLLGAHCQVDADGKVRSIRFAGSIYTDAVINALSKIDGVERIDIRDTNISPEGAARLRQMLPQTVIQHHETS